MKNLKPDIAYSDLLYNHTAGQNNTSNNTQKVKYIDIRKIKGSKCRAAVK